MLEIRIPILCTGCDLDIEIPDHQLEESGLEESNNTQKVHEWAGLTDTTECRLKLGTIDLYEHWLPENIEEIEDAIKLVEDRAKLDVYIYGAESDVWVAYLDQLDDMGYTIGEFGDAHQSSIYDDYLDEWLRDEMLIITTGGCNDTGGLTAFLEYVGIDTVASFLETEAGYQFRQNTINPSQIDIYRD